MSKLIGVIRCFDKDSGWITQDNGGADVFVSSYVIVSEGFKVLAVGQKISYDIIQGPKSLEAVDVRVI